MQDADLLEKIHGDLWLAEPEYTRHVTVSPWLKGRCTCRRSREGKRYFTCATNLLRIGYCTRVGQACGGYCAPCFERKMRKAPTLSLREIAEANRERALMWHAGDASEWTGADWSNAMCGEAGEAANVVKKLRRLETGSPGSRDAGREELVNHLADELADTLLYLDLLAAHYEIDLAAAVRDKFNRVSEREGFPQRLC